MGSLRIGGYEVETLLGPGGVTETYKVRRIDPPADDDPQQRYALKLLRDDRGGGDAEVRARFAGATARLAALELEAVARVLEPAAAAGGNGPAFAVSELVPGADLATLVEGAGAEGVPPAAAGWIAAQVARVLDALHEAADPIAHGGLAPGNVIVDEGGEVVVLDVGVAAALRPVTETAADRWWFAAPEVVRGEEPTAASDLYSLGAVLYFVLTGNPPHAAETPEELVAHAEAGPPELPALPPYLERALRALLAPTPAGRPKSAASAALALTPLTGGGRRAARLGEAAATPEPKTVVAGLVAKAVRLSGAGGSGVGVTLAPLAPASWSPGPPPAGVATLGLGAAVAGDSLYETAALSPSYAVPLSGAAAMPDGILDLPPAAQSRVELPELIDRQPSVLDSSGLAAALGTNGGAKDTGALGPDALAARGAEEPGAADEGSKGGKRPVPLPRMRGSARAKTAGGRARAKLARWGVTAALVVGGCAAIAGLAVGARQLQQARQAARAVAPVPPPPKRAPAASAPAPATAASADAPARKRTPGKLSLVTTPAGAIVWIDGVEKGRTPMVLQTKPGGHRVVIVKPGYKMVREVADTTDGQSLQRTLSPANANFGGLTALKVQCKTEDKYPIFIDGRDTGLLCPSDNVMIPEGSRLVGLFVIPQNKVWTFEREIPRGAKAHRVVFNY